MSKDPDSPTWLPPNQYGNYKMYKKATADIQEFLGVPQNRGYSMLIPAALAKKKEYDDKNMQIHISRFQQLTTAIELRAEVYKFCKPLDGDSKERENSTMSHGYFIQLLKDTRRILFPPSDRKSYVPPEKQPDNRNRNVYELLQTDDDTDSEPADPLTERMELPFRNTELFMTLIRLDEFHSIFLDLCGGVNTGEDLILLAFLYMMGLKICKELLGATPRPTSLFHPIWEEVHKLSNYQIWEFDLGQWSQNTDSRHPVRARPPMDGWMRGYVAERAMKALGDFKKKWKNDGKLDSSLPEDVAQGKYMLLVGQSGLDYQAMTEILTNMGNLLKEEDQDSAANPAPAPSRKRKRDASDSVPASQSKPQTRRDMNIIACNGLADLRRFLEGPSNSPDIFLVFQLRMMLDMHRRVLCSTTPPRGDLSCRLTGQTYVSHVSDSFRSMILSQSKDKTPPFSFGGFYLDGKPVPEKDPDDNALKTVLENSWKTKTEPHKIKMTSKADLYHNNPLLVGATMFDMAWEAMRMGTAACLNRGNLCIILLLYRSLQQSNRLHLKVPILEHVLQDYESYFLPLEGLATARTKSLYDEYIEVMGGTLGALPGMLGRKSTALWSSKLFEESFIHSSVYPGEPTRHWKIRLQGDNRSSTDVTDHVYDRINADYMAQSVKQAFEKMHNRATIEVKNDRTGFMLDWIGLAKACKFIVNAFEPATDQWKSMPGMKTLQRLLYKLSKQTTGVDDDANIAKFCDELKERFEIDDGTGDGDDGTAPAAKIHNTRQATQPQSALNLTGLSIDDVDKKSSATIRQWELQTFP